tara:strand:+ start:41412 stop:43715 length:2304 start_codon:yes stop_codon:yes gene_type:complete
MATPTRNVVSLPTATIDGQELCDVELGGWVSGQPLGTAPVCLVVGGITATPFPFGGDGHEAWWPSLAAEDLIDPSSMTVLCPEWPGNGSTYKGVDDPNHRVFLSVQGLADLVEFWLVGIGCKEPLQFVGASLGALVGFALAQRHPKRVSHLVTISAGLRPDGWGTATRHVQRELVRDGLRNGDVHTGMARARQLGMLTYRGRGELDTRFASLSPSLSKPPVAEYLEHHGKRFAESFPVATFLLLSEAIDRCSFGETPSAIRSAVEAVDAKVTVIGVPGDQLFPWALQEELHRELQASGATSSLWKLDSEFGHDAFLADQEKLAAILRSSACFRVATATTTSTRYLGVGVEPVRTIRIGLIGCGTVGRSLLELLQEQDGAMAERYAVHFEVTRICVRDATKDRGSLAADIPKVGNVLELVSSADVDVIVEAAGGLALEGALRAALASGKPVVTANKVLLAASLGELGVLAQRTATPLSCEAAVCASVPILRHLSHRADEINSLQGIVNGTCNYLLTRLEQDEQNFSDALEQAQALGLAEADPSADVDGHDAAAKLSILCYRAFGVWVPTSTMDVRGITALCPADCDLAESLGFRIRHIAHARRHEGGLLCGVEPLLMPSWHLLASVEEEYNAIYMQCENSGDLSLFGKGAGGMPTATAVLGDLIDLAQENTMRWPEPRELAVAGAGSVARRHYLRISADPHPGIGRRVESLLRRAGLTIQGSAKRDETKCTQLGFLLSESTDAAFEEALVGIRALTRVVTTLGLGVGE